MKILKKLSPVLIIAIIAVNAVFSTISEVRDYRDEKEKTAQIAMEKGKKHYSSQETYNLSEDEIRQNLYSNLYKQYLKLSDEEKENREVIPRKYKISFEDFFEEKENSDNLYVDNASNIKDDVKGIRSKVGNPDENTISGDEYTNTPGGDEYTNTPGGDEYTNTPGGDEYTNTPDDDDYTNSPYNNYTNETYTNTPGGDEIEVSEIPESYDLRDRIYIKVENQNPHQICWSFASLNSLETYLELNEKAELDFSELHVDYLESEAFGVERELHDGGNFDLFKDYVSENKGPVLEEEVPYTAVYTESDYGYLGSLEPKASVSKVVGFPSVFKYVAGKENTIYTSDYIEPNPDGGKRGGNQGNVIIDENALTDENMLSEEEIQVFRESVKNHIMKNGSLYAVVESPNEQNYNETTRSAYSSGDVMNADHAVSIIGWDDNYSKENFLESNRPKGDGAYLVLNSWGENHGNNGTYYVSYEDVSIEVDLWGVTEATINTENLPTKTITFEDENLYNTLKEDLASYIISSDDVNYEIELNGIAINSIFELDLSDKNITNISGLEEFVNLTYLNLEDNDISNIDNLDTLNKLKYLFLNNNNIEEISFANNLSQLSNLYLENNNITNGAFIQHLADEDVEVHLKGNKNINLSTIDFSNIKYLDLSECNIEELNFDEEIPNDDKPRILVLSDNNIESLEGLPNLIYDYLDLSNNQSIILDVDLNTKRLNLSNCNLTDDKINEQLENKHYELIHLDLSKNPIETLDFLNNFQIGSLELGEEYIDGYLDISYTNITDITELYPNNGHCITLDVSGLKNLVGMDKLGEELVTLIAKDCDLESIDNLINTNIKMFSLEDNSISQVSDDWNNKEDIVINLTGNKIQDLSNITNIYIAHTNQRINTEIDLQVEKDNYLDIPKIIENAYSEKEVTEISFETTNCEINLETGKILINSDELGEGVATIKINGGSFDGSLYTINYNMIENVPVTGIEAEYTGPVTYIEGENFETQGLKVYIVYENGLKEEITDYEIENNTNLQVSNEAIRITYDTYETSININVVDDELVRTVKFNEQALYEYFLEGNPDYEDGFIRKNDEEKEIKCLDTFLDLQNGNIEINDEISDLSGLSSFKNINLLKLYNYNSNDLTKIVQIENLNGVEINCTGEPITEINTLAETGLTHIEITNSKIKNTSNIYDELNLEQFTIESIFDIDDLENDGNIVYLPDCYSELLEKCENPSIVVLYNTKQEISEVKQDGEGKYYVELDKEEPEREIEGSREVSILLADGEKGISLSIQIKYIVEGDVNNPDNPDNPDNPIEPVNPENLGYQVKGECLIGINPNTPIDAFTQIIKGNKAYAVVVKEDKEDGTTIVTTGNLKTGMIVELQDGEGNCLNDINGEPAVYEISVKGDVNGDGEADAVDSLWIKAFRGEVPGVEMTTIAFEAADINGDNIINYIDSNLLKLHRLEVEEYNLNYKEANS